MTVLDMADLYGTHPLVSNTVKGTPRDRYVLLSNIWTNRESWVTPSGGAKAEGDDTLARMRNVGGGPA